MISTRRTAWAVGLAWTVCLAGCGAPTRAVTGAALAPFRAVDRAILRSVVRNPIQPASPGARVPLGAQAPSFELSDALGETFRTEDFRSAPVLVVAFVSNSCRQVKHIQKGLVAFASEYQKRGVVTVAINPNDPARHPEDGIESVSAEMASGGYTFPYLIDVKQEVAKAFLASGTPEFYVFDKNRRLAYQGAFDDSVPGAGKEVTGRDLRAAVDAVLAGSEVPTGSTPTGGCPITWMAGTRTQSASTREVIETDRGTIVREREATGAISGTLTGIAAILSLPFKLVGGILDFLF